MKNKGFTLVELLAVIAILAILVIIAIPNVLKMFNDSKKNAFMVQARKTANVAQEHTVMSSDKTFDCNSLLTGQKFKDCTATVDKNNQVSVDVLGSGAYENFLMVDVTPNANSGTFVDLSKLNTIETEKINNFSMTETDSRFELVGADEYIQIYSKIFKSKTESELNTEKEKYSNNINKIFIKDGKFYSKDDFIKLMYKININANEAGNYSLSWQFPGEFINKKSVMNTGNYNLDPNTIITNLSLDDSSFTVKGNISISEEDTYYFAVTFNDEKGSNGVSLVQDRLLEINDDEHIMLSPTEVSSYKDAGVSYKGKTLTDNDVYTYTNLKDKEGEYKYNYIIKTNQGVKVLRRYITVSNYTSEKCFAFDSESGTITKYYDNKENDSSKPVCPTDVVIPTKINGKKVLVIGEYAFCKNYEENTQDGRITSVVLPETLTVIERGAFYGNKIKTLTIPKNVTEIKDSAFENNLLQKVTFEGTKIRGGCGAFNGEKHSAEVNSLSVPVC